MPILQIYFLQLKFVQSIIQEIIMKAKLMKAIALASLGAFLTVGIGTNVAQAKDYHFKIGENHRMVKNDDGTVDSSDHPWYKVKEKKHRKHRISKREKHDKNATAKRSERHQRSESSND